MSHVAPAVQLPDRCSEGRRLAILHKSAPLRWAVAAVLTSVSLSACTGPVRVHSVDPVKASRRVEGGAVRSDRPSEQTLQTLRLLDLGDLLEDAPAAVFRALDTLYRETRQPVHLAAAAEIALLEARKAGAARRQDTASWYLLAASRSYEYLFAPRPVLAERAFDPQFQDMRILYGRSVAGFVVWLQDSGKGLADLSVATPWETFEIHVEHGPGSWDPEEFDELLPAEGLEVRGLENRYHEPGFGAPLVAVRKNLGRLPTERFYPPEGMIWPATAVLTFDLPAPPLAGGRWRTRLSLVDPRRRSQVKGPQGPTPLAADFTTPFAYLLSRTDLKPGLLKPESVQEHAGLFLMQPYDPLRIPVIMVHGLWSTPLAWMELTNDLVGDPELREGYQIWHFVYPTSLPYLYAGGMLRQALADVHSAFDPEGDDPAMASMVVVAHSMGGLLARTLITDSGMSLWNTLFTRPPEALEASPRDLALLRRTLIFRPEPCIDRVIFIAVPHGGSTLADSFLGRLGAGLARLPDEVAELFQRVSAANPGAVKPAMEKPLQGGGPVSIRTLSPRHPMLQALARLPIDESVPYHSIIANRGPVGGEPTTDGVVEYRSAHLPGAASERIIPAGHAAYAAPLAIKEIRRILRLHLRQGWALGGPVAARP